MIFFSSWIKLNLALLMYIMSQMQMIFLKASLEVH